MRQDSQTVVAPLDLLDNIETAVDNELVHVSSLFAEASDTIATSFGSAKLMFKQRIVPRANDGEVVGHSGSYKQLNCLV